MGFKKLTQQKMMNKKVGVIGTVAGKVVQLGDVRISENGNKYVNGKVLVMGAQYPTNFSVFPTVKNPDLVDQFLALCEHDANVIIMVAPKQDSYKDNEGKDRLGLQLRIIGLPDPEKAKNFSLDTLDAYGFHIEDGSTYSEADGDKDSFMIFRFGVTQTWFNQENGEQSRTDEYEFRAYGKIADKVAEDFSEAKTGDMANIKLGIDGQRLIIKSASPVAPEVAAAAANGGTPAIDPSAIPF